MQKSPSHSRGLPDLEKGLPLNEFPPFRSMIVVKIDQFLDGQGENLLRATK
jgi:hypothetical protein